MRWCTREPGRYRRAPTGQMAVVRAILQNPLHGHRRHQRRQGASERRAGEARSPRADRRPAELVAAGHRRRIRGAGTPAAPRSRLRGAVSLSRDCAERLPARPSQGTTTIGAALAAPLGGPSRQARSAAADAPQPRSRLTGLRRSRPGRPRRLTDRCCSRGRRARRCRPFRAPEHPSRRAARPPWRGPRWAARGVSGSGRGGSRAGSSPDCGRR